MVPQKTTRASKPPKTKSIFGFTLIELIVVITILAILGTIGFLSIWGYSSKARDSARIGDVAQISKSLDLSIVTAWTYPAPDNAFTITYSWGSVWTQGTVGANVLQVFHSSIAGGGLGKKPVDPLTNTEYVYSSLTFGKAYQLKVNYEGDLNQTAWNIGNGSLHASGASNTLTSLLAPTSSLLSSLDAPSLTEEAAAAPGAPSIAYIRGNYGGLVAKTVTGSITYVLAVPSIITSSGSTGNFINIGSDTLSGTLLFSGKPLKSASTFNPNIVVYSGSSLPTSDTAGAIATMMTSLKSAYSWATDINATQNIASLLSTSNTGSLVSLGSSVITGQLGGAVGTTYASNPTTYSACNPSTYSGVTIPAMNHGVSQSFNKVIASGTWDVTATCTNGNLSYGSLNTSCTTNYVANGTWSCTLDTCTGSAPSFSQINGTQGTASWSHSTTAWVCKYQCQAGYYYNGSNACIAASAGYYVPAAGGISQTACGVGMFQDSTAQTSCNTPSSGYWASPTNGGTANTAQTPCTAGNYCSGGVRNTASAGYYVMSAGATSQWPCTAGYYCSAWSTTATQNLCPANSYCPIGSGSPTACTWGSTSPSGSTNAGACVSSSAIPTWVTSQIGGSAWTECASYSTSSPLNTSTFYTNCAWSQRMLVAIYDGVTAFGIWEKTAYNPSWTDVQFLPWAYWSTKSDWWTTLRWNGYCTGLSCSVNFHRQWSPMHYTYALYQRYNNPVENVYSNSNWAENYHVGGSLLWDSNYGSSRWVMKYYTR